MDVGVKRKDELNEWLPKDPIARSRGRLLEAGESDDGCDGVVRAAATEGEDGGGVARGAAAADCAGVRRAAATEVEDAVWFARESPYPGEAEMTKHVWVTPDERLAR